MSLALAQLIGQGGDFPDRRWECLQSLSANTTMCSERQPGPGGAIPLLASTVPYTRRSSNSNSVLSPLRLRVPRPAGRDNEIQLANEQTLPLSSVHVCVLSLLQAPGNFARSSVRLASSRTALNQRAGLRAGWPPWPLRPAGSADPARSLQPPLGGLHV